MSIVVVQESGMDFPLDDTKTFFIEKSTFVNKLNGFQLCEYVTIDNNSRVNMVEAKTSFAKPTNTQDFEEDIQEIVDKYSDSLQIFNALLLRHPLESSVAQMTGVNLRNADYLLVFVVKSLPLDGLPPIMNALKSRMKSVLKLWNIPDTFVKVFNEDKARAFGIIR
jgi:hypothetical protein